MPPWIRKLATWCAPIVAIACAAAIGGTVVEGVVHAKRAAVIVAGCGVAVPVIAIGVALGGALLRIVGRGWRPVLDRTDGPRVLAGLLVAVAALVIVFGAGYIGAQYGVAITRLAWLAAVFAAAAAVLAVLAVLALAPLALAGVARAVRAVWPRVTPRLALTVVGGAFAAAIFVGLAVARALLARYDLQLTAFLAGFLGAGAAIAIVLRKRPRLRPALGAAGVLACLAIWIAGKVVIAGDATALIDGWAGLPVTGRVIERRYDVGDLREAAIGAPAPLVARTPVHPDILLIVVDSLRADRLTPQHMPALSAWSTGAAVFDHAYAPSTVTRASVPSLTTGLLPGRIRGRPIDFAIKLDPRHVLLAERLAQAGYTTRGFMCCSHHFGGPFALGHDRGLAQVTYDPDGEHLAEAAQLFFRDPAHDAAPRFGWLYLYEPHQWAVRYGTTLYGDAPGPRYDRTVASVDRIVAPLLAAVRERGRPTIIMFTADHGEGLGEHGIRTHASVPYTSLIHVPLVISAPNLAARRVTTPTSLLGLAATLVDLAGFDMPPADGTTFAHLVRGEAPRPGDGFAYSVVRRDRFIGVTAFSLIANDRHLIEIEGQPPQLYDPRADRGELVDLAAREPDVVSALAAKLAQLRARDETPAF